MSSTSAPSIQVPKNKTNWPLIIGLILIAVIAILAVWGPTWAPKDPREQKLIIQVDGTWLTPPYRAFTKGYPLGSDNLGRDLYSWLLWSVRPTMILVLVVAALRMAIGVVLGVMAGYSDRLPGKIADMLIAAALSVPALIASIMVITAVGFHLGVWAFVLGLVATGWAETASLVRERTRTIRAQQAVEASVALGSSSGQTFFLHILPQVMPMVWMLLAFEVSNTLVTSAGLGFLGYYLGGAVFQEVDDFVYQRISDMPELGQMLATAWLVLDEPWAMVAAGTVVFIIVLAFNLLGEGLQNRLARKLGGARSFYLTMAGSILPWWDDHVAEPVGTLIRKRAFQFGALVVVMAIVTVTLIGKVRMPDPSMVAETATPQPTATQAADADTEDGGLVNTLLTPGDHYWTSDYADPWRTRLVNYTGPITNTVQWKFETPLGFASGPAVDKDGVLYITARDKDEAEQDTGLLYAVSPDGQELWQTSMPAKPVGTPALTSDGMLVVCDKTGVSAFDAEGTGMWRFDIEQGGVPTAGPAIDAEGNIYVKAQDGMWALNPGGTLRWHTPMSDTNSALTPHISPDGSKLYWQAIALDTVTGEVLTLEVVEELVASFLNIPVGADGELPEIEGIEEIVAPLLQYVVGADGEQYYRFGEAIYGQSAESRVADTLLFDGSEHTWDGADAGVMPDGQVWLLARPTSGGMGLGFFWGQPGSAEDVAGKLSVPQARNIKVLAVDREQTTYVCMDSYNSESSCVAIAPESVKSRLRFQFRGVQAIAGSALAPGRLYVATRDGTLMAIGDDPDTIVQPGEEPVEDNTIKVLSTWDSPNYVGGHYWSHEKGDPWGTRSASFEGPADAKMLWMMENGAGYMAAPVVAADGTIYANATDSRLMAYNPDGSFKWAARLGVPGVGSPAIGPDGTIYITDEAGNLLAYDPAGEMKWRFHASGELIEERYNSNGEVMREEVHILDGLGPAGTGPMVAPDGTIYFTMAVRVRFYGGGVAALRSEVLLAVTPQGVGLYDEPSFIWTGRQIPRLSANDTWLVLHDHFLTPRTEIEPAGALLNDLWDSQQAFYEQEDHEGLDMLLVTGANGGLYRAYKRVVEQYVVGDDGLTLLPVFEWTEEESPGTLVDIGATPNGYLWMFFRNGSIAWLSPDGELSGPVRFPLESILFGLDSNRVAYGCGSSMGKAPECMAYAPDIEEALWHVTLQESEKVAGGALAPGVVYVTTEQGRLYALGTP